MPSLGDRLKHAWSAFNNQDKVFNYQVMGSGSYYSPDRPRMTRGSERSLLNSIITRISIDAASVNVRHVKIDQNGDYSETVNDGLNYCLTSEANIDQASREFLRSSISMMLDVGHVAIIPTRTSANPQKTDAYDVFEMRAGKVITWYPQYVAVDLYNDKLGRHDEIIMPKKAVAIAYNPFYSVMNEPNSTLQRLKRKLVILDAIDEQSGSGKLDLIIQLPYTIKSEGRKLQAEQRRADIERQLTGSKYGIAYIDSTEHITQLNRAVENNLMKQIEYLTGELYGQLGLTNEIINGTANEQVMLNYNNRTVEPVLSAIIDEMRRTFLSKAARTRGHSIAIFRDPFKLVPVSQLAELADKFTRNEIISPNEFRVNALGYKPSEDPEANELRNRNLNKPVQPGMADPNGVDENALEAESMLENGEITKEEYDELIAKFDDLDAQLDDLENQYG